MIPVGGQRRACLALLCDAVMSPTLACKTRDLHFVFRPLLSFGTPTANGGDGAELNVWFLAGRSRQLLAQSKPEHHDRDWP